MFKFLDPSGCTYYDGIPFAYNLPARGQKWSEWTVHPEPADPDGAACGPGRLHLMNRLDARYAPANWWPWWARGVHAVGGDGEKTAFGAVQLRRIDRRVFWRCLRPPFNWGKGADLRRADLRRADLRSANLWGADLRRADLRGSNLRKADLYGADLRGADLYGANLYGANLTRADLSGANLYGANLSGADLSGANRWAGDPEIPGWRLTGNGELQARKA